MDCLKSKEVCFGSLSGGHMSKRCTLRFFCRVCSLKHSTILDIHKRDDKEKAVTSALVISDYMSPTGPGESDCILFIVPVRVKIKKGHRIIETYAFLDSGSTGTFCTEALL